MTPLLGRAAEKRIDTYPNFSTLSQNETEGTDFSVTVVDRGAAISVFAIHGGKIEPMTSEVARACAGQDLNLYLFEGSKRNHNGVLHITSERFDEPRARKLAAESSKCVSIHGFAEKSHEIIGVGGGSPELMERFIHLSTDLFQVRVSQQFPGASPGNIVNRGRTPGLQLELSTAIRDHLKKDPALLARLAQVVRLALQSGQQVSL